MLRRLRDVYEPEMISVRFVLRAACIVSECHAGMSEYTNDEIYLLLAWL